MGRDPSNDYVVPSSTFPGVSSRHARLFFEEDVLWVEDAGSKKKSKKTATRKKAARTSPSAKKKAQLKKKSVASRKKKARTVRGS